MDVVKLAEAIAWPLATVVVAVVLLLVTRMIVSKSMKLGFSWKDLFKFEADASAQIAQTVTTPEPIALPVPSQAAIQAGEPALIEERAIETRPDGTADPVEDPTEGALSEMIQAENVADLQRAFDDYKEAVDEEDDRDFWTTYYVDKKREFGVSGTPEELRALADANPSWVNPILSLLRSTIASHDLETANGLIKQALARRPKGTQTHVLQSIVHAYYRLVSPERALQFYQETVAGGATSNERSAMLIGFARSFDKSSETFSFRTAMEMGLLIEPGSASDQFALAHSYAEENRTWSIAFDRYRNIDPKSDQYVWSLNNRGVMLENLDKSSSLDYYARGMQGGNSLSTSNLARSLINDGYYAVAERLLDEITDPQDAAEHIASSRAAALAGRRVMTKRRDEIAAFAADEMNRYTAVTAKALRSFERNDPAPRGIYSSEDKSILVLFDNAGAAVRVTIGTLSFEGVVPDRTLGYSGNLSAKGQSALSGIVAINLLVTAADEVAAIIWPQTQNTNERIRIIDLRLATALPHTAIEQQPAAAQISA